MGHFLTFSNIFFSTYYFCTNYSTIRTNDYGTLKIEEILNLTIFVRFSFFQLRNIGGTRYKYF